MNPLMSKTRIVTHVHWTCTAPGPVSQLDASYSFVLKWATLWDVNEYDNGRFAIYIAGVLVQTA